MTTDWRALCAELVKELDDLRESSEGVAGLHRNGDLAPWSELGESGEFPWLSSFDRARAALAEPDGPAVSDDREPASVTDQLNYQLYRRAKILFVRKVIDQALRDTASVQWRVADTGEQLVRATDLLAWAEHMEKQMEQLDD